jgi:hypothetical protein
MDIKDFAGTTPEFLPETFFAGSLRGWGLLESLLGGLQKRFVVQAQGEWDRGTQIVSFTETWTFDNGRSDTLQWKIRKLGPGRYSGHEARIEGEAKGEQAGYAFHWAYSRNTPQDDGKTALLNFDDWFYRIDDQVAIVSASAGRAGIPFSIVHATYRKM